MLLFSDPKTPKTPNQRPSRPTPRTDRRHCSGRAADAQDAIARWPQDAHGPRPHNIAPRRRRRQICPRRFQDAQDAQSALEGSQMTAPGRTSATGHSIVVNPSRPESLPRAARSSSSTLGPTTDLALIGSGYLVHSPRYHNISNCKMRASSSLARCMCQLKIKWREAQQECSASGPHTLSQKTPESLRFHRLAVATLTFKTLDQLAARQ